MTAVDENAHLISSPQYWAESPAAVESWLASFGLRFNPFHYLEASNDPYLGEYVVGHDLFAVAWAEAPALIFAPAGGGKTAMRIYTTRSCWVGLGGTHPFPIPYLFPHQARLERTASANEHLQGLASATASALLIGLAFRPEIFLALQATQRQTLAAVLDHTLPGPLAYYLSILREEGTPLALLPLLEKTYRLPTPPTLAVLYDFCAALESAIPYNAQPSSPQTQFEQLIDLVLGPLGFRSIFMLVDGVDAAPETLDNSERVADWLAWLFEQTAAWTPRRIFLKAFLPIETSFVLEQHFPSIVPQIQQATLEWSPPLLAEVVRRRIYVASKGELGSLDAISSPALRDIETQLAKQVTPLPREMLQLAGFVLEESALRSANAPTQIEPEDLKVAIMRYHSQ